MHHKRSVVLMVLSFASLQLNLIVMVSCRNQRSVIKWIPFWTNRLVHFSRNMIWTWYTIAALFHNWLHRQLWKQSSKYWWNWYQTIIDMLSSITGKNYCRFIRFSGTKQPTNKPGFSNRCGSWLSDIFLIFWFQIWTNTRTFPIISVFCT
jgi:hypothetical protein